MATAVAWGLSEEQLSFVRENGYLRIRGVIDPWEVATLDRATRALIDIRMKEPVADDDFRYSTDPLTGKRYLSRINDMSFQGDPYYALYGHPRLLAIVESLFGPDLCSGRDEAKSQLRRNDVDG